MAPCGHHAKVGRAICTKIVSCASWGQLLNLVDDTQVEVADMDHALVERLLHWLAS